jgi:hypothetical protein
MKTTSFLAAALALALNFSGQAQDAATEERLNRLTGQMEDMRANQEALRKKVEALEREVESLREQMSKPTGNYASQDDLRRLSESVKEVDQKRIDDAEKVRSELLGLKKDLLKSPLPKQKSSTPSEPARSEKTEKGFEYVVQRGDNLSSIIQAYRDKNIKITMDQVLKANPNLKPDQMRVGQKIFLPAPPP